MHADSFFHNASIFNNEYLLTSDIVRRGIVNSGNIARLQRVISAAARGRTILLSFIGGSITEGAAATTKEKRYVEIVSMWWHNTFPDSQIETLNAGVGATGSNFGALRLQQDVLSRHPDVIVVEFAVNDLLNEAKEQTMEGILRQALNSPNHPAVILLFMLRNDGSNAQETFSRLGAYYDVPMISFRDAIWPEIQAGRIQWEDISPDTIHPNDRGHSYVAKTINAFFTKVLESLSVNELRPETYQLPDPLSSDLYEHTSLFAGDSLNPALNQGWVFETPDNPKAAGWKATKHGSVLEFDISGTCILLQFWKVNGSMGMVCVTIDGECPKNFDAWYDQTWGGYNSTQVIGNNLRGGKHRVRIELLENRNPQSSGNEFRITAIGSAGVDK